MDATCTGRDGARTPQRGTGGRGTRCPKVVAGKARHYRHDTDSASYHCCQAEGSVNPDSFTSREDVVEVVLSVSGALDQGSLTPRTQYKLGRANRQGPVAGGDSLDDLRRRLRDRLRIRAERERVTVNRMKIDLL